MATIIGAVDHNDTAHVLNKSLKRLIGAEDQFIILGIAPRLSNEITDHKVISSAKRAEQALLTSLGEKTEKLRSALGQACELDLVSGNPAQKIIESAVLRKADIVVKEDDQLASDTRGRIGNVARTLLKRSPTATLILRKPIEILTPQVVIAVDNPENKLEGTERGLLNARVFKTGIEMAKRLGANEVTLLHVWTMADLKFLQHPRSGLSEEGVNQHIDKAKAIAAKWFEAFRQEAETKYADADIEFKTKLVLGEGGKALAEAADELRPDLFILGSANRRGVYSLFFGNTADDVLNWAECNLLVVKPADFYDLVAV